MTERLHFHFSLSCIGEWNGNHSAVLAWIIPGTGEPGGLPSTGSHRVGHNWSDLAAAAGSSDHGIFQVRLLEQGSISQLLPCENPCGIPSHFEGKFDMILILEHPRDISRNRGSYLRPVETHIHKTMSWKGLPCFLRHHGPGNQSGFTYEPICSLSCLASLQPWIKLSSSLYDPILSFELLLSLRDSDSNLAF